MTSPITGLTATPSEPNAWMLLAWTNHGATQSRIQGKSVTRGTAYTTWYEGAAITTRRMPQPHNDDLWLWQVQANDGSGWSTPVELATSVALPPQSGRWYISLTSYDDPTLQVFLGAPTSGDSGELWVPEKFIYELSAGGQEDTDYAFDEHLRYIADGMDWMIPPYTRSDGTRVKPWTAKRDLLRMYVEEHTLFYRGYEGDMYDCLMTSPPRVAAINNVSKHAAFGLRTTAPQPFPLTIAVP